MPRLCWCGARRPGPRSFVTRGLYTSTRCVPRTEPQQGPDELMLRETGSSAQASVRRRQSVCQPRASGSQYPPGRAASRRPPLRANPPRAGLTGTSTATPAGQDRRQRPNTQPAGERGASHPHFLCSRGERAGPEATPPHSPPAEGAWWGGGWGVQPSAPKSWHTSMACTTESSIFCCVV